MKSVHYNCHVTGITCFADDKTNHEKFNITHKSVTRLLRTHCTVCYKNRCSMVSARLSSPTVCVRSTAATLDQLTGPHFSSHWWNTSVKQLRGSPRRWVSIAWSWEKLRPVAIPNFLHLLGIWEDTVSVNMNKDTPPLVPEGRGTHNHNTTINYTTTDQKMSGRDH